VPQASRIVSRARWRLGGVSIPDWRAGLRRVQAIEFDVVTFLTVWLALLYLLSARQIFGPLGAVGSPAMIAGMGAALVWVCAWLLPHTGLHHEPHPMRPILLLWCWYAVVSYAIAMTRPLTELELTGADRGLVTVLAMVGIALLAADGIGDIDGTMNLLRRLTYLGAIMAVIGIGEFLYGTRLEVLMPGLTWDRPSAVASRFGFNRPRATALHPIEFSVVMGALLPLALHFALYDRTRRRRRVAAAIVVLIGVAIPMSVSRSGVVALVVGLLVLAVGWGPRRGGNAAAAAAAGALVLWWALPGLMDTVVGLFTETQDSHSIQSRIERVPRIMELVRERPWFGLGNGTWSVEDYFLIDNEIWVTTLEMGIVGLTLTAVLLLTGAVVALCIRSLPGTDEATGHLGRAVAASIAALGISLITFDAFHYRILTGTLFLLLGVAGALWRLTSDQAPSPPFQPWTSPGGSSRAEVGVETPPGGQALEAATSRGDG
jgi:polysaccharide biosynthesis protein PslJ